jgi:hypothetical protein
MFYQGFVFFHVKICNKVLVILLHDYMLAIWRDPQFFGFGPPGYLTSIRFGHVYVLLALFLDTVEGTIIQGVKSIICTWILLDCFSRGEFTVAFGSKVDFVVCFRV